MRRALAVVAMVLVAVMVSPRPLASAPGDPIRDRQWALSRIGAAQAWGKARGAGVKVAVIDSGVDLQHEDLTANLLPGVSCIGSLGDPSRCSGSAQDDDGHGTHVAGILAAVTGNGVGISGVAPDARIIPIRAIKHLCTPLPQGERCGAEGRVDDARAALHWAVDHGAKVVNLSVADDVVTRSATGSPLRSEVERAWAKGVIVVVAAGNDLDVLMGSGYDGAPLLVVGATTRDDQKASYANSVGDARWGVSAPGGTGDRSCPDHDVLSTYLEAGSASAYACLSGTSMAAPHVAGAAADLLSMGLSPSQVVDRILSTTDDLGDPGRDRVFGHGLLNLARAVGGPGRALPAEAPGSQPASVPPAAAPAVPAASAAPPSAPSGTTPPVAQSGDESTPPTTKAPKGAKGRPSGRGTEQAAPTITSPASDDHDPSLFPWPFIALALIVGAALGSWRVRLLERTGR